MLNVDRIREALMPYREDLGKDALKDHEGRYCAIGAMHAKLIGPWEDHVDATRRYRERGAGTVRLQAETFIDYYGLPPEEVDMEARKRGVWQRLVDANNNAPDGFARFQAVMAAAHAIYQEQLQERREANAARI